MKREKLEYVPVGKRTRLQRCLREKEVSERNKKVRMGARSKHRKVYAEENILNNEDDSDDEDVKVVDEAEYLRYLSLLGYRDCSPDVAVVFEENSDNSAQLVDVAVVLEENCDNSAQLVDVAVVLQENSDNSAQQLVVERLNPLSIGVDNDNDNDNDKDNEDGFEGCADLMEDYPFSGMKPGSEATGGVGDDGQSLGMHQGVEGGGSDDCQSSPVQPNCVSDNDTHSATSLDDDDHKSSDEDFEVDEAEIRNIFSPEYSSSEDGECGKKTRARDNNKEEVVPVTVSDVDHGIVHKDVDNADHGIFDNRLEKNSDEEIQKRLDDNEMYVQLVFKSGEYGSNINQSESELPNELPEPKSKSEILRMLRKKSNEAFNSVCKSPKKSNEALISSPRKHDEAINSTLHIKKRNRKLKPNEAEHIMLNTILENRNAGLNFCIESASIHSATVSEKNMNLPLKFRFGGQNTPPKIVEEDGDAENLFQDLEFALRTCDIGIHTSFGDEHDEFNPCDNAVEQEKLCHEGKHCLIHDDEIGIRCKYCSLVKLEIRHVTPAFNKNPFGRDRSRNSGQFPSENANALTGSHLPDCIGDPANSQSNSFQGTVWELIPGILETLYPHQQEAFEFMWRNIEGGIKLNELGNPTKFGSGGCIICHAPGTGKTRLAITFLLSFIRKYPMSKPVIIAPKSMLLTWEEEFARWNIDVPFININKPELSGNEDLEVLKHAENVKHLKTIRVAKLYTWAMGKGILGISYTLFEQLAGDRKGVDKQIRRALLEQPGILVLDEGHTPRNDQSNIWNVLNDVQTKRRIILSGTPFQNNFEELINTVSLVREEFENPLLPGKRMKYARNSTVRRGLLDCNVDNDRRIAMLKNRMKPFLHIHKGEILKKTLRGLFHSVLLLKPSDLQKTCFQQLNSLKNGLKLDHLVSVASVHPSLLHSCDQIPDFLKVQLKYHRRNIDAGVKIRFLFDLINLAQGEKILVFSQFLTPLKLIRNLLKSRYHWAEEKELLYMDGKQDVKQRQAFIRHFNNPKSEARVLLASTKACCEGIHLVGASRVVLLDVVWNPSVERQAISRAYRLGQKKDVFVYHLITSGTQEEDKYYWQVTKDRVSEKMFSSEIESKQNVGMIPTVSEDRILEEMIQNEKIRNMFVKIIYQPKADELIESFGPVNL